MPWIGCKVLAITTARICCMQFSRIVVVTTIVATHRGRINWRWLSRRRERWPKAWCGPSLVTSITVTVRTRTPRASSGNLHPIWVGALSVRDGGGRAGDVCRRRFSRPGANTTLRDRDGRFLHRQTPTGACCRDNTRMRILGPIFRFELVRIARRQRLTTSRCLFASALSGVAAAVYITAYKEAPLPLTLHEIASITEGLCYGFLGILFAVAVMFTPQWTADAIASEKERRTLPFLLLTDLTSHEIILGKLGSRLVQIGFFVLAALPVLVGLQFFGGVEPTLILVAVAALGATMWSLGSLTMVASGVCPHAANCRAAGRPGVRTLHRRHDDARASFSGRFHRSAIGREHALICSTFTNG